MTDDVSTGLQKDLDKVDAQIDEKLEKWGDKLRNDLFAEMKNALEHFNAEPVSMKKSMLNLVEMGSSEKLPRNGSNTLEMGQGSKASARLPKRTNLSDPILDPLKVDPHRNLDCPRFNGHDFLGWFMKIQQFFEDVGIQEEEKITLVMINLEG